MTDVDEIPMGVAGMVTPVFQGGLVCSFSPGNRRVLEGNNTVTAGGEVSGERKGEKA